MKDAALACLSIQELGALYRKRKVSPVEVTRLMLERIERLNPALNAYLTVSADRALGEAKKAETELFGGRGKKRDRGPLHGIPISLKDNIYTKDVRTTAGSKILRDFVPLHDAAVAKQLREAGAVLLGKTNLHEFAYGVTTNNPHYGPTRNPWDRDRIPGGSSGGSAAAVAAGLCYGSIGTDTGGSIRIPASLCGVVGLKPTFGLVSVEGTVPLSPKLDCVGPLARSVEDAALLLKPILVRGKPSDSVTKAPRNPARKGKFRLGVPKEIYADAFAAEILEAFSKALSAYERTGVSTNEVSVPLWHTTEDAGNQIAWAEATHYHQQAGWFPVRADEYSEDVRGRIERGSRVTAVTYLKALEEREEFIRQLHSLLQEARLDALILPTTPIPAPLIGEETTTIDGNEYPTRALLLRLNRPANLAGVPAISIPCGLTSQRLPIGLQLIGAVTDESMLLQIAAKFEKARPRPPRPPNCD
jgi:aspartyl-tRNA(Asn)/glutamyl-tRNA(Gln) amidotransferase subunit A